MNTLTIPYPPEVLWALQKNPQELEAEARLLLALKLYETGKLSTGLAAQLAGVPRPGGPDKVPDASGGSGDISFQQGSGSKTSASPVA